MKSYLLKTIPFMLILIASTIAQATPEKLVVDPSHALASYSVGHLGLSEQRGFFKKVEGTIVVDVEKKTASADISIALNSITTASDKLNEHLLSTDFFDEKKFPTMTFKSTNSKWSKDKLVELTGELTLKGKTLPVTLTVTEFNSKIHPMLKKQAYGAVAHTKISRSAFGITTYEGAIGDTVEINLNLEAVSVSQN